MGYPYQPIRPRVLVARSSSAACPAVRVLEDSCGRPPEHLVLELDQDGDEVELEKITTAQVEAWLGDQRRAMAAATSFEGESDQAEIDTITPSSVAVVTST